MADKKAAGEPEAGTAKDERTNVMPSSGPRWSVSELMKGGREVVLEHDGQDYRLRITSKNKLILTK
jgi:hemin uptake protein HemP